MFVHKAVGVEHIERRGQAGGKLHGVLNRKALAVDDRGELASTAPSRP